MRTSPNRRATRACAGIALVLGTFAAAGVAEADVCVASNIGRQCAGPGGNRTTVTVLVGCCLFVESDGPIQLGRTGLVGFGVSGTSAGAFVVVDEEQVANASVAPGVARATVTLGGERIVTQVQVGCCAHVEASGPIPVGRTGVTGTEVDLSVWVNGQPEIVCPTSEGPWGCRITRLDEPLPMHDLRGP